jgi:aryl sulfotransferase
MFVHYTNLLADLEGEIARIATFLGYDRDADRCAQIAAVTNFAAMKRDAAIVNPGAQYAFRGGPTTFINKGTNGRWRDVLTPAEIALYGETIARELPADAANWLETGMLPASGPETVLA